MCLIRELFIANALSRHFAWSHNILFAEELSPRVSLGCPLKPKTQSESFPGKGKGPISTISEGPNSSYYIGFNEEISDVEESRSSSYALNSQGASSPEPPHSVRHHLFLSSPLVISIPQCPHACTSSFTLDLLV